MPFPYFTGKSGQLSSEESLNLPPPSVDPDNAPGDYLVPDGLGYAADAALLLGRPLLLTGEPGTGKSTFADHLAWKFRFGKVLKFETRSTSLARDLFYTYDSLRRFRSAPEDSADAKDFLEWQALGKALLLSRDSQEREKFLKQGHDLLNMPIQRSVVLIDEVDKAPRDFPNDILNEIDQFYVRVFELQNARLDAGPNHRPIVVITSNSEKDLPEAFLRRCVYHHIDFPDEKQLQKIVSLKQGIELTDRILPEAIKFFYFLRSRESGLEKNPATAEMLDWFRLLGQLRKQHGPDGEVTDMNLETLLPPSLGTLLKHPADMKKASRIIEAWKNRPKKS